MRDFFCVNVIFFFLSLNTKLLIDLLFVQKDIKNPA